MTSSPPLSYARIDPQQPPRSAPRLLVIISRMVLALSLCGVGIIACSLFFYAVPVWDDLIRATRPTEVGWWGYVIDFVYKHWQGRWASCGLESVVLPRVDLTRYYSLLLGTVAMVNAIAVYAVCRWFTPRAPRSASAFMAIGLLALLWTGMPSVGETVYWFTGAVENAMVYALSALLLMALIHLPDPSKQSPVKRITLVALFSVAAICIVGFHELYGLMLCATLSLGSLAAFTDKRIDRSAWISVTIAAGIGLLIVILAPGNSARFISDGGPHARHFIYDFRIALSQVRYFIPHWIIDPRLLAVSIWVLVNPMLRTQQVRSTFPWRWAIPIVWLTMLAAGFFAPSWAFGNWMPPRTISGVYILFVLGWLGTLYLWTPVIHPRLTRHSAITSAVALLVLSISFFLPGSAYASVHDLYHRIIPWHSAMEHRYTLLRKARDTDALVPVLPTRPWVLLDGEIVNDPGDYRNWSTVSFFHLRSIRLIPPIGDPPPPPERPTRPPAKGM